jgi:hypothetical protein
MKTYNGEWHNDDKNVKTSHFCNKCGKEWRSSDSWGFTFCPFCSNPGTGTRIDYSEGKNPMQSFKGEDYQLQRPQTQQQDTQPQRQKTQPTKTSKQLQREQWLSQLQRVIKFTKAET